MELSIRSIVVSDDDNVIISGDVLGQNDWRTAFYIKIVCNDKVLIKKGIPQLPYSFEFTCPDVAKDKCNVLYVLLERYRLFAVQRKIYRLKIQDSIGKMAEDPEASLLYKDLEKFLGQSVLIVLKPNHLNILGQVFTPVICGTIIETSKEYVELKNVNIRMNFAPDFEFPTRLVIPLSQLSVFTPFDRNIKFSLM